MDSENIYNPNNDELTDQIKSFIECPCCHGCIKSIDEGLVCIKCDHMVCTKCYEKLPNRHKCVYCRAENYRPRNMSRLEMLAI